MSIFKKAMKAGVAKKAIDEAKKPHNQAKIKGFISSLKGGTDRRGAPKPRSTGYR
jgi:hypothetical protein